MYSKNDLLTVLGNIFRTPLLRNVFLVCLAITVLLPTYSSFFVMPSFVDQLMRNTENEAFRTAVHLSGSLFENKRHPLLKNLSAETGAEITRAAADFNIQKIKVFSPAGKIVFSTDKQEVGQLNERDYFREIVAAGKLYSKVVEKNQPTAEDNLATRDVAEVYVPLMNGQGFLGAFEIYYDITERKEALDRILFRSSQVLYGIAVVLFLSFLIVLLKASGSMINREKAELLLTETNTLLENKVFEQTREIQVTQKTSIEALAVLAEYYDPDTGAHLSRIQKYVVLLLSWLQEKSPYADYIRNKKDYIANTAFASLLHDIGKVAIAKEILLKPGKLSPEEFKAIRQHTQIAGQVLNRANETFVEFFGKDSYLALARDIALFHHEKWNGEGYPSRLRGEDIPLSARVVALADVYDALRSKRPYKEPKSHAWAVEEIRREKDRHFDPWVVEAFLAQTAEFERISTALNESGAGDLEKGPHFSAPSI